MGCPCSLGGFPLTPPLTILLHRPQGGCALLWLLEGPVRSTACWGEGRAVEAPRCSSPSSHGGVTPVTRSPGEGVAGAEFSGRWQIPWTEFVSLRFPSCSRPCQGVSLGPRCQGQHPEATGLGGVGNVRGLGFLNWTGLCPSRPLVVVARGQLGYRSRAPGPPAPPVGAVPQGVTREEIGGWDHLLGPGLSTHIPP